MSQTSLSPLADVAPNSVPMVSAAATVDAAPSLRRFTVGEYHRLGESGFFDGNERLELLEGIITMMSPIGLAHGQAVLKSLKAFERLIPTGWQVLSQQAITLDTSEPVPDVIVLRGNLLTYTQLPQATDLGLIIEVSDSTLRQDRQTKARIYAAAGIPEYWIVNLIDRKLEVNRRPVAALGEQPARYESVEMLGPDDAVKVVLDGAAVGDLQVRDILP
jgi:Uma2 family endonuclease